MAPALPRTRFNSAELVRLLAELTPAQVPDATQTLAERLGQWLGWTDAIALSAVLHADGSAASLPLARAGRAPATGASPAAQAQRVREALLHGVAADPLWSPQGPRPAGWAEDAQDLAAYRRQYRGHQQAMAQALGPLRARVRTALAARSAALGQLAALDAVLEQALAARERQCLAAVPGLLEQHGQALKRAEAAAGAPATAAPLPAWVARMATLVPAVLRAELALRWQPIDGMLEALASFQADEAHEEPIPLDE